MSVAVREPGYTTAYQRVTVVNPDGQPFGPMPHLTSKASLQTVEVHGTRTSPPVSKVRMLLAYYGVPNTLIRCTPMYARRGGDGQYTKIPVVVVNGEYEVRDSAAITIALAPLLQGRPLTGNT
jgi:hypothetical protein